jgi:hypothetical protein
MGVYARLRETIALSQGVLTHWRRKHRTPIVLNPRRDIIDHLADAHAIA